MLLDFDHDVVDVDELTLDWPVSEGRQRHDLLEAVVELDEVGQRCLKYLSASAEVSETAHHVAVDVLQGSLPV